MARKIVIFADGTGNTVGGFDSNVLRLCKLLDFSGPANQIAIYDPGVGTTASFEAVRAALPPPVRLIEPDSRQSALMRWMELPLGALFGFGTKRNIRRLYRQLISVYEPGDEIFLFGFSRGAFTVRALAGVIYRCGIPRRESIEHVDNALALTEKHFEACRSAEELRDLKQAAEEFKRKHAHLSDIRFLGVWDTVKSVGYIFPRNLPHTRHNPIVQTVRHALSLGERRSFYAATTWGGLDGDTRPAIHVPAHYVADQQPAIQWQDVQEVWFPGDHSDIGGGHKETTAADVSLHWMINEAHAAGLRVDASRYGKIVPKLQNLSPSDLHDEMKRNLLWTVLWQLMEYCPRRDIANEPPPPRLSMLRPNSLGPRAVATAARQGFVNIHRSAERCYCQNSAPWHETKFRFIDTIERVKDSATQAGRQAGA
jgi:uncharacterized protein (DUF2235 family)